MITEMIHKTRLHEISLTVEPLSDKIMGLKVREDGITKAEFGLAEVWDFVGDALRDTYDPTQWLGLERRCYEASNIRRLTAEWIKTKEKEEQ